MIKKIFWGLFFILAAAFIIVNQLGYYTNINLFSLILTIFITAIFISSVYHVNFFGILFSIAVILIIYSEPLHLEALTPWPVLITAFLGSIGLSIIFNKHRIYTKHVCSSEHFDQVVNDPDADIVDFSVSFGSSIKYINSENFTRANLISSFGALKVYFDNAKIVGDEAIINLDVSFSGVELYIPKEWKIVNKTNVSLGGVEEKNRSSSVTTKTVTITGRVSLGGVEIIYV